VDAEPKVVFVTEAGEVTRRQMEALIAVGDHGSLKRAAAYLGISTPVLYKYVKDAEGKVGERLVVSNSRGTNLTAAGRELVSRFDACTLRLQEDPSLHIAGTVVSEGCLLAAATRLLSAGTECRVTVSTDAANLRMADEGRVDCVVLDDPLHAVERSEEVGGVEIGSDILLMRDSGPRFVRARFGAQRLGFRYLDESGREYEIEKDVLDPAALDRTDLSYFVNRSLVRRGLVRATRAREQRWSVHSIVALPLTGHNDLADLISEARRTWVYPKG
jgi:DNA-binding transcriptional LysR family regulator